MSAHTPAEFKRKQSEYCVATIAPKENKVIEDRLFQEQVCEIYGCLRVARDVAGDAAGYVGWCAAGGAAFHAGWNAAGYTTHNAAAEAAGDAAEEVVGPVAREAVAEELKTSRPEKVGITAAKAVLKCIFGGEEVVRSAVSTRLQSITMQRKVDRVATILKLLTLKMDKFQKMALEGQCWYLARVYRLICQLTEDEMQWTCQSKLLAVAKSCAPTVLQFIEAVIGCDYSFSEMMDAIGKIEETSQLLLPPLWKIVYDYLAPLSPSEVKQEIMLRALL